MNRIATAGLPPLLSVKCKLEISNAAGAKIDNVQAQKKFVSGHLFQHAIRRHKHNAFSRWVLRMFSAAECLSAPVKVYLSF